MFLQVVNAAFLPEGIKSADQSLFFKVNGEWHNAFFDVILPYVREPMVWVPFYFFLALFAILNFGKRGWIWVLVLIATAMISDYTSSSIIKDMFPRLRPCRDPEIAHRVRFLVAYCPISSSFVSSHAVNHFAVSTFIFVTFKHAIGRQWAFVFLWALLICYAQVYVGVHYPLDVAAGGIVGIILGYVTSTVFNRFFHLPVSR